MHNSYLQVEEKLLCHNIYASDIIIIINYSVLRHLLVGN